jgi:hypothetical protein
MASPMRLDNVLVQEAETVAERNKRSVPKQIEYWAELGRAVERVLNPTDVLAVTQGLAEIQLIVPKSARVAPDDVFAALEHDRAHSQLAPKVTRAALYYEASTAKPGLLDRVQPNGQRDMGRFVDGEFQIVPG